MTNSFGKYNLPLDVKFCKLCTISNQRPSSSIEFKTKKDNDFKKAIGFDDDGICSACNYAKKKCKVNWIEREKELIELCNKHRRNDGRYDVIVPGSGGKDSVKAAHILKNKYNMNPILVTWPPAIYTEVGRLNFDSWLSSGFANYTYNQNKKLHKFLTKNAFLNLCHPFQPFILGQKNLAPKMSILLDIPLVIYGENEAEYGNPVDEAEKPFRDPKYYSLLDQNINELSLGGLTVKEIIKEHNFRLSDLEAYLPADSDKLKKTGTQVHYLGYYLKWHPQETYYYAVENTNFIPNFSRTEGSYSKYSSIDDKIDWLHYHTTYIKFGIGRATYDSAQEIRNGDITRDEGISLIKRFDGEFPSEYINECCDYMGISIDDYHDTIEKFRTPHLWEKKHGEWNLINPIWNEKI